MDPMDGMDWVDGTVEREGVTRDRRGGRWLAGGVYTSEAEVCAGRRQAVRLGERVTEGVDTSESEACTRAARGEVGGRGGWLDFLQSSRQGEGHAAQSLHSNSACSSTVCVAFSCMSGG